MPRIYALLVGINDYAPNVSKLSGCISDIESVQGYLTRSFDPASLAIEVLKDADATRGNIIGQFRSHLGRAQAGDVALFHYCGHGARSASAGAFREFFPGGRDEGLVCIDSRLPGGFDLADKELAVLIAEVARNDPHLAIMLDCCHSGSATRSADDIRGLTARATYEVTDERPLETYLDGHYAQLLNAGQPLSIPAARHILLAACERTQTAKENAARGGVFTSALIEVLEKSGGDLSYADLFVRCRAAVRDRADKQDPQFEAYGGFNGQSGFLGRAASFAAPRYSVYFRDGRWQADCGAVHGVPTAPDTPVTLALTPETGQGQRAGTATTTRVGPQSSELALGFAGDEAVRYRAEITSLPAAPLLIGFEGPDLVRAAVEAALAADAMAGVALAASGETGLTLAVEGGQLLLKQATGLLVQGAALADGPGALLPTLKHVAAFERSLKLANPHTAMEPALVDFVFAEAGASEFVHPGADISLDFETGNYVRGKIKVRNLSGQTLYMALVYYSGAYGIHALRNEPIGSRDAWVTLWGDGPGDHFGLRDGANLSVDQFKLIVSTERVDDFLLVQPGLELGRIVQPVRDIGSFAPINKPQHRNEWFTKDLRFTTVRRLNAVSNRDAALAGGSIRIKGHPSVTANLGLASAQAAARSLGGGADFHRALEGAGLALINFAAAPGSRDGEDSSILELTDIRNAEALTAQPLEIELDVPLAEGEALLPLVHDGQFLLLAGESWTDAAGTSHVRIDHLPEAPDNRRSLGGALKLYFFKTALGRQRVNSLRWLEFKPDGSFEYCSDGLMEKVAAAGNILLLIHGIIGDTAAIATGVQGCGLDRQFDLVLAYDYENLNTPIEETARQLRDALAGAGIDAGDGKQLTLLVHSMGGLVSRWFIEREGGKAMVDHLVMCGTPNAGSPFGRVGEAGRLFKLLTELALNVVPPLAAFGNALLGKLNVLGTLTPTLEQMNPQSDFIATLNASEDPGVRYTILAGDVALYDASADRLIGRLVASAGRGFAFEALFANAANDIAVSQESIRHIGGRRTLAPTRLDVACHHLNYFHSATGQQALSAVKWVP